jgi:hypothetical protein
MGLREQLRTFHLTGDGLEEWMPPARQPAASLDDREVVGMFAQAINKGRGSLRDGFLAEMRRIATALEDLLAVDAARRAGVPTSDELRASLGNQSDFFRAGVLREALAREPHASAAMDPLRRQHCQDTLTDLLSGMREELDRPACYVFHSGSLTHPPESVSDGVRYSSDPCAAALEFSMGELDRWALLIRTLRIARLESRGVFDPDLHGAACDRIEWQSLDQCELAACTPMIVYDSAEHLTGPSLKSLGRLLRSGQPILVIAKWAGWRTVSPALASELGMVAMLHREALVLQSSLDWPEHLREGAARLGASSMPSLAIVARTSMSLMFPPYCFDPGRGASLREHLAIGTDVREDQVVSTMVAEMPEDIRLLPDAAACEKLVAGELMEWCEYLDQYKSAPPLALPFVRVPGPSGTEQCAVLTRSLIHILRERRRAGQMLAEICGSPAVDRNPDLEHARRSGAIQAIEKVLALLSPN